MLKFYNASQGAKPKFLLEKKKSITITILQNRLL